jgi:hypothetical protein
MLNSTASQVASVMLSLEQQKKVWKTLNGRISNVLYKLSYCNVWNIGIKILVSFESMGYFIWIFEEK